MGRLEGKAALITGAAKAGVVNLTRTIAAEYGSAGIRANCICPGIIVTPIWRQVSMMALER